MRRSERRLKRFVAIRQADDHTDVRVAYATCPEEAALDIARKLKLHVRNSGEALSALSHLGFQGLT